MELHDSLLVITNELTATEVVTVPDERTVGNDLDLFGLIVPVREARAFTGALLVMVLLTGVIYATTVRRRLGRGELAKIRLRYGSMIVPASTSLTNGSKPVDVSSMADLVKLARLADQMVFYERTSPGEHWFVVPDGSVTYQYHFSERQQRPS
jgi:hypothetical protein